MRARACMREDGRLFSWLIVLFGEDFVSLRCMFFGDEWCFRVKSK